MLLTRLRGTAATYISRLVGIPQLEQAVEYPFGGFDALLLVLLRVFCREGLGGDVGPVRPSIKVQQAEVCEEKVGEGEGEGEGELFIRGRHCRLGDGAVSRWM